MTETAGRLESETRVPILEGRAYRLVIFFGGVFPGVAAGTELTFGILETWIVDIAPTRFHLVSGLLSVLVCIVVPDLDRRNLDRPVVGRLLRLAVGYTVGVAAFYSILFVPLLNISFVLIIFFGAGLLGFSPFTQLGASSSLWWAIRDLNPRASRRALLAGLALSLGTFATLELAPFAKDKALEARNLGAIRSLVRRNELAAACRGLPVGFESVIGSARRRQYFGSPRASRLMDSGKFSRSLYYRVTGEPIEEVDLTNWAPLRMKSLGDRDVVRSAPLDTDVHQATSRVGHRVWGLALSASRFEGAVENDAAVATFRWHMTFVNRHPDLPREARARVRLPEGAVVSGLAAKMHGEWREAAYGTVEQVRRAYQSVVPKQSLRVAVISNRDPLLVRDDGPDRVFIQCFPVPPGGGTMEIRIDITAPCRLVTPDRARLTLPWLVERNFPVGADGARLVALEASGRIESDRPALAVTARDGDYTVRGALTETSISRDPPTLRVWRDPAARRSWTEDPTDPRGVASIVQEIVDSAPSPTPARVTLVLDSSQRMTPHLGDIASALREAPSGIEWRLLTPNDSEELTDPSHERLRGASATIVAAAVGSLTAEGGRDNARVLIEAVDTTRAAEGVVLWIHSGQTERLYGSDKALFASGRWESTSPRDPPRELTSARHERPIVFELQVAGGRSVVIEDYASELRLRTVAPSGSPADDLRRLFRAWSGDAAAPVARRAARRESPPTDAVHASPAIAVLAAKERIDRALEGALSDEATEEPTKRGELAKLAMDHRIVTPLTSAVVLETDEEYGVHGLRRPPESGKELQVALAPALPEPEEVALIALAALLLGAVLWREWAVRRRSVERARIPTAGA